MGLCFWRKKGSPAPETVTSQEPSSIPGFTLSAIAREDILAGKATEGLWTDRLKFENENHLFVLPPELKVPTLVIDNCPNFESLPEGLFADNVRIRNCEKFSRVPKNIWVKHLSIEGCPSLTKLPEGLRLVEVTILGCLNLTCLTERFYCTRLRMPGSQLRTIPADIAVEDTLDLEESDQMTHLPSLHLRRLSLRRCANLLQLPDELEVETLDISGCNRLRWQEFAFIQTTSLNISNCAQLDYLPDWLIVEGEIDIANTSLTGLPQGLKRCRLLWRGIPIDERIAFHPTSITMEEILRERNVERRRVMLERVGMERFLEAVDHRVMHADIDSGGDRRLLHFAFLDGEELLVLSVACPSSGRRYLIRVPPWMKNCHEAAAWVAGFDDPREYRPISES